MCTHSLPPPQLRHSDRALVGVSVEGDEFVVTFERALTLDTTHQVLLLIAVCVRARVRRGGRWSGCAHPPVLRLHALAHAHPPVPPNPPVPPQVVGRLTGEYEEVLDKISALSTDPEDVPFQRVRVQRCGFTDAGGWRARVGGVRACAGAGRPSQPA